MDLFFRLHKPFPSLAAGLPRKVDEAEREFDRRVRDKFPVGSSEAAIKAALRQEGWGEPRAYKDMYYVNFTRASSFIMEQSATIVWKVDEQGRLTDIRGGYGLTGL